MKFFFFIKIYTFYTFLNIIIDLFFALYSKILKYDEFKNMNNAL